MNQGYLCKSESKSKIPMSRLTTGRNSLQCQIPAMKSRRSSSADSRPRSSGGGISKPRCMSEERKSVFNNNRRKSSININECKVLKEQRPLSDRGYQKKKIMELIDFLNETSFKHQITPTKLMQPSKKDFENIFEHLDHFLNLIMYLLFEVDQKTFFQSVECENPQEFTILLNYIFNAYRSGADDEEKEFAVFKSIIKKRFPCDFEDLEEKNAQLNMALEQYEKRSE
ncbi:putative kinetochore protein NDC80 [Caerostris extrusa]|uniref:Kinetochore protein NDC80 n=1 Tax=Caerostris extrusa TaxID=172846 RepID=A0AAV4RW28_CAEEX|nr:putative kinetochore protein NDC80 [Caerostris extrusa]